jgi:GntR family transcriptional regulator/MocR family aminotransferase
VVYVGTFSKTMLPALRVGYLVVPAGLAETFAAVIRLTGHTVPTALQLALADFIAEGHLAAHVRRMRILYAARQERLVGAARRRLAGTLDVTPVEAGLQLAALLPPGADDVAISAAADAAGIVAPPLAMYHLGRRRRPGLLLGYAGVPEREIDAGVERLARVLAAHRRP